MIDQKKENKLNEEKLVCSPSGQLSAVSMAMSIVPEVFALPYTAMCDVDAPRGCQNELAIRQNMKLTVNENTDCCESRDGHAVLDNIEVVFYLTNRNAETERKFCARSASALPRSRPRSPTHTKCRRDGVALDLWSPHVSWRKSKVEVAN